MADRSSSWKHGDAAPVVTQAVPTATVIEVGDIMGDINGAVPIAAADETWDTTLAITQGNFHDNFGGVAAQRSRSGDVKPVRVNTRGVHEFDTASATYVLGELVGPAKASGNALENQKVASVANEGLSIGRIAKAYPVAVTKVLVEVISVTMWGGPQAPAT